MYFQVTHVGENCDEDGIFSLLDQTAGSWKENGVNYAEKIYQIAIMCLEEKKKRPNMVVIRDLLLEFTN